MDTRVNRDRTPSPTPESATQVARHDQSDTSVSQKPATPVKVVINKPATTDKADTAQAVSPGTSANPTGVGVRVTRSGRVVNTPSRYKE